MKVKFKEIRFLAYFLPIFIIKLLNITAENKILIGTSVACFALFVTSFVRNRIESKIFYIFIMFGVYTALLVLTCGKQGAFFSVITIIALYGIDDKRKIYKILFFAGLITLIISCYIERNGGETIRYIGGEWTTIFKRSNILYVSYTAVVCLWLILRQQNTVKKSELCVLFIIGYGMYKYTGSRTGFLTMLILLVLLFAFRFNVLQKNIIFKSMCVSSPLIAMVISCVTAWLYGKSSVIYILDNMMQGRLRQGNLYFNRYNLRLFGQRIYESSNPLEYWNLDCAYLDMLICYGVFFAVIWVTFSCIVIKYLYDRERHIEVSIMVMYAIYGIPETFLPNCFLNVSLFFYAECLYFIMKNKYRKVRGLEHENKNNCNVSSSIS